MGMGVYTALYGIAHANLENFDDCGKQMVAVDLVKPWRLFADEVTQ